MPALLEKKEARNAFAEAAVQSAKKNVDLAPARPEHPLAKQMPERPPLLPKAKANAPHPPEEAKRASEQTKEAAKAMEQITNAYADGHGARTAQAMLKEKGQPAPPSIAQEAKLEQRETTTDRSTQGEGVLASFMKPPSGGKSQPTPQQQAYTTAFPTLVCTGITNDETVARDLAGQLSGHADDQHSMAAYAPDGGFLDPAKDGTAVLRYASLAEQVQVDDNGQVVMSPDQNQSYQRDVGVGLIGTTWYKSPAELGSTGADKVLSQMMGPDQKGQVDPNQFISIQAHSGGGQSAFFTLVELHQRGYTNLSLVGYEMALSPHEREVLEKLGVQVTNFSGHNGERTSATGNDLRMLMGGGEDYYDALIDRPDESTILGGTMHSMNTTNQSGAAQQNIEKTQAMIQFTVWLDQQNMHQEWTPENFEKFKESTGYTPSQDPLAGNNLYRPQVQEPAIG